MLLKCNLTERTGMCAFPLFTVARKPAPSMKLKRLRKNLSQLWPRNPCLNLTSANSKPSKIKDNIMQIYKTQQDALDALTQLRTHLTSRMQETVFDSDLRRDIWNTFGQVWDAVANYPHEPFSVMLMVPCQILFTVAPCDNCTTSWLIMFTGDNDMDLTLEDALTGWGVITDEDNGTEEYYCPNCVKKMQVFF